MRSLSGSGDMVRGEGEEFVFDLPRGFGVCIGVTGSGGAASWGNACACGGALLVVALGVVSCDWMSVLPKPPSLRAVVLSLVVTFGVGSVIRCTISCAIRWPFVMVHVLSLAFLSMILIGPL